MKAIIDKLILFFICSFFLIGHEPYGDAFEVLLISITLCALMTGLSKRAVTLAVCVLYVFLAFLTGLPFYAYLPLMCYEMFYSFSDFCKRNLSFNRHFYIAGGYIALSCALVMLCRVPENTHAWFLLLPLMIASGYFAVCTRLYAITEAESEHQENLNRGNELLMKKRQEDFKAQQDAEVHLATLKERNRIAREIHDNVGHMLSRALLLTGALEVVNKDENLKEPITNLKETLGEAMENVRESVHDLYDESIDLGATIESIVKEYTFCPVELDLESGKYMNKDIKYCIISILKEALSNTAKHSNATLVKVMLRSHETEYQLLIEDNGTISINSDGTGIGLESMRERVRALSGTIFVSSENGYRIFATLPKPHA